MSTGEQNARHQAPMRLAIELGTEVSLDAARIVGRLRSHVVGMAPGRYLILTAPPAQPPGPLHQQFREGDVVIVRYIYNGSVFGFRSFVSTVATSPERLVFIAHPAHVEEYNIRAAPRLDCFVPAVLEFAQSVACEGTISDMSKTGCQVLIRSEHFGESPPAHGDEVTLKFRLPGREQDLSLQGEVRRIDQDGERLRIGIAFDEPAEEAYRQVYEYLSPGTD